MFLGGCARVLFDRLFRLLARLPLPWLHRLGGWVGWLVYWSSPKYRHRLRENLTRATGERASVTLGAVLVASGGARVHVTIRDGSRIAGMVRASCTTRNASITAAPPGGIEPFGVSVVAMFAEKAPELHAA